ncbi:PLP-dependent aminotransferase family protein [Bacillus tianshenii]|nr:PLP-dependent aminotransferase family protein [Bacillus tianshenii]
MNWKPTKQDKAPMYEQIINYIREKITNGEWPVGSRLPSQRKLAEQFSVNRSTVVTAMEELAADGLIEGKTSRGTIVINNTWTILAATPPPDWNAYVKSGAHKPNRPIVQEINRVEAETELIQLGKGEIAPELFPTEEFAKVLGLVAGQVQSLGYMEPKGLFPLRQAISHHLQTIGIHASPASILVVSGALQALQLIAIGLLHKGSTILLEKPSYLYSVNVFQSAGMRMFGLPMDENGISPQHISEQKRQRNAAMLYTNPSFQNPTSILMSEKRRKQLLQVCEDEQLPIVEDDVYRELWLNAPPPAPLKAYDRNGQVLYVSSLSKTLGPGLRIGWITGPEPVIDRLADIKMQTDYGSSSLSQWTAAEWLSSGLYATHLDHVRKQLKIRKQTAIKALEKHVNGLAEWHEPQGGFFIWVKATFPLSMEALFEEALAQGVLLYPGTIYASEQTFRISYSFASLEDIEQGIEIIGNILKCFAL